MFARFAHWLGVGLIVVAVLIVLGGVHVNHALLTPVRGSPQSAALVVERGATLAQLANGLQANGTIADARALLWYGRISGLASRIKAGEYRIEDSDTIVSLLAKMVAGKSIQYSITFVEGWSFKQFRAAMARSAMLTQATAGWTGAQIMSALDRADEHPEGRFFPDTYIYSRGGSDLDVLRRAGAAMKQKLAAAWNDKAQGLPYKSAYEALIMASIVEKETGAAHERVRIAGVFVRRLRKNMKLQTDPTVIYGMGDRFDGDIRRKDLREDTPYNTYVHKGLPPTPIANPGADAIYAALHPEPGTVLYFVAKGDGTHQFSDTYAQHNRAVKRYILSRRQTSK
jgi:UPF0755 protein